MIRTRTSIATLAVVVGVGATVAASTTIGPASAHPATTARRFTVHMHPGHETNLDLGKSGFSAGDQDLMTGSVSGPGKHHGRVAGSCTTLRVGAKTADQLCEFDLRFRDGEIVTRGAVTSTQSGPGTFRLAIVGGTGAYQKAAGQIKVTATDGSAIPVVVRLR